MKFPSRALSLPAQIMTASDLFFDRLKRAVIRLSFVFILLILVWSAQIRTFAQTLDAGYNPNVTGIVVYDTAVQPDGKVVIGGNFTQVGSAARNSLARLNADGTLDPGFVANANNTIFTIVQLPNGKFYVGGAFDVIGGQSRKAFARLNADGTIDLAFDLALTNTFPFILISAAALQPDGKVIVVGTFITAGGQPRNRIARLNADGSLDEGFNPNANGTIDNVALLRDGKILIAGSFNTIGGVPYNGIARLNADGTVDKGFNDPFVGQSISALLPQPDGKILIAGSFNQVSQQPRTRFARLNVDGTLDANFNPVFAQSPPLSVSGLSLALQADGKIIVAGGFTSVNGTARNNLARLNADGSLDESFANFAFSNFSTVNGITLQPGGNLLAAGSFSTVDGQTRNRLARIINTAPAQSNIAVTPTSLLWTRGGTAPEFGRVTFERSSDGVNYTFLGNASRVGTTPNWILRGLNLPVGQAVFVRARGYYQTAYFNSAGSIAESIVNQTLNVRTVFDFDGDGKADQSVFRPSDSVWYLLGSQTGVSAVRWGLQEDKLAPADFDGDGKTDIAVFREGNWYILQSSNRSFRSEAFGMTGDAPLPGDFDADGRADLAVFRPSNGTWYVRNLTSGQTLSVRWGLSTDKPVAGDFDGDGRSDFTVYRNGVWYLLRNGGGTAYINFGLPTDVPVVADYDGDKMADIAVFRAGTWYRRTPNGNFIAFQFGAPGDIPVPADYDGDGKADFALYRSGVWFAQNSTAGFSVVNFGFNTDRPVPAAYVP